MEMPVEQTSLANHIDASTDKAQLDEIAKRLLKHKIILAFILKECVEEFKERIRKVKAKFPYLVCEKDGVIVGYVYASAYSEREAYSWTVSTSIYVDKDFRRQGIGSFLYENLEERLKQLGIKNILAGAAFTETEDEYLTQDSPKFHEKMGYVRVAQFKEIGKKFDRWYDLVWQQKKLN